MYHYHSRANDLSAMPEYPSIRVATRGIVGATRFNIVVQAGAVFTRSVLDAVHRLTNKGVGSVSINAVASESDEETLDLIGTLGQQSDAFALLGKNTERVKAALLELRSFGIPVIALISDLDANVRSTYIGGDNRAAGQLAGLIFGRCLERESRAQVAIVACNLAYRCWEDREIGFRSLLRRRFPQIELVEVVIESYSPQATCEAALRVLSHGRAVDGIYNVAGENQGLAQAISEIRFPSRPLFITHELDEATEPLLRAGVIDFLITQNLDSVVSVARRFLIDLRTGGAGCGKVNLVPIELISNFNLHSRTRL
jgi:LacI family transcriptional regulator